tara:strand:+ start:194 stop:514 length:321 start_codon:yes stop_codon:yes gene_type:complete
MVSTGDINKKYEIVGVVGSNINNQEDGAPIKGCGGCGTPVSTKVSISNEETYEKAAQRLLELANQKGGDAVIYAAFEYRIAIAGSGNFAKQVKELFCYGTAVKIID